MWGRKDSEEGRREKYVGEEGKCRGGGKGHNNILQQQNQAAVKLLGHELLAGLIATTGRDIFNGPKPVLKNA